MSLTSFLADNKDVRTRMRQEVPNPRCLVHKAIIAPPISDRYALVGTAFDYALRFYVQRLNPSAIEPASWIAENAVSLLANNPILYANGQAAVDGARQHHKVFLKNGRFTDELLTSTLRLARLDALYRAGVGHDAIGGIHTDDVRDLRNLLAIVESATFTARGLCLLNPTFGEASLLVGGADADLVIDDMLIDIKTTKNFKLTSNDFQQLIGYYILHEIAGSSLSTPKGAINKLGIYVARYAYLHVFAIRELINSKTFPRFVVWFKQRASERNMLVDANQCEQSSFIL